jgi:hypothetical protein
MTGSGNMGTLENGLKREWLRLTAENAQLTRDLADTKAALVRMTEYRDGALANEERLEAENERLRAALEPFAEVARWAKRNGHDLTTGWDMLIRGNGAICHLGVQSPEFINALSALEQSAREEGK